MERELVVAAMRGDHDAFTRLTRASIDRSYSLARLIVRDEEWAGDAVQEAYLEAWRDLRALRDPERFEAWFSRLLVRACYREAERERRQRRVEVREIALGGPPPIARPSDLAERDEIERAFRRLAPDHRAVLVLCHYLGLSMAEAAEAMGVPLGTAKSRLHYATRAMRAALEAEARGQLIGQGGPA